MSDREIYKLGKPGETKAEFKVRLRKAGALNTALALSSGQELKLIMVKQKDYPIHLIEKCFNNFILFFKDGFNQVMPGRLLGNARPGWVGPRYKILRYWAPLPYSSRFGKDKEEITLVNAYQVLEDLQNGRSNEFWSEQESELARDLLRRKAVVL